MLDCGGAEAVRVHAFISHADDWCLAHHLRVYSKLADQIFVVLDRSPQSEVICQKFPKVQFRHAESDPADVGMRPDGAAWSEGRLRQMVWDWATACDPRYVLLGDTDEVPTPHALLWLYDGFGDDDKVDCFYADWANLIHDTRHAIGGSSAWSYQVPANNKKGFAVRYVKGRDYRYRHGTRHVRMEPSPLMEAGTGHDDLHKTGPVPLVHYRWANWPRWQADPAAALPAYQPWPPSDARIIDVPHHWIWRWDADRLLAKLPEPIAVVGNGPCVGTGPEIDTFASVIRFNNFVTDGYEDHVGCRTDLWCTNCWDDVTPRAWPGEMMTVYTIGEQPDRLAKWLGMYPHMHVPLRSWSDDAREVKPSNPSTGLRVVHQLRRIGKQFKTFGFDGMKTGHYWDASHKHNHPSEAGIFAQG